MKMFMPYPSKRTARPTPWCHRMDMVEMKAFRMMENREDAAVARATAGMIMMADTQEAHIKAHPVAETEPDY